MAKSKILPGTALVVMACFVGFVVGAFIGGLLVPAGSGLAGGAIVFGYGVGGFLVALVLGIVLAVKLPRPHLVRAAWLALVGVAVAAVALFIRYLENQ